MESTAKLRRWCRLCWQDGIIHTIDRDVASRLAASAHDAAVKSFGGNCQGDIRIAETKKGKRERKETSR